MATQNEKELLLSILGDFAFRLDDTSTANVTYVGFATTGTPTSDDSWQIRKIDKSSGVAITWADGDELYNNVWDDRTGLTYS